MMLISQLRCKKKKINSKDKGHLKWFLCASSSCLCIYTACVAGPWRGQKKKALDLRTMPIGSPVEGFKCWEPDPSPLQKQQRLLTIFQSQIGFSWLFLKLALSLMFNFYFLLSPFPAQFPDNTLQWFGCSWPPFLPSPKLFMPALLSVFCFHSNIFQTFFCKQ